MDVGKDSSQVKTLFPRPTLRSPGASHGDGLHASWKLFGPTPTALLSLDSIEMLGALSIASIAFHLVASLGRPETAHYSIVDLTELDMNRSGEINTLALPAASVQQCRRGQPSCSFLLWKAHQCALKPSCDEESIVGHPKSTSIRSCGQLHSAESCSWHRVERRP